jgi:hypothetical protein
MSGSDGQTALRVDNFRRRLATVDQRLAAVNGRLAKEFPGYANLSNPGPLALSRVQALLGPDGVWRSIAITEAELSKRVARFRPGLDLN